MWFQHTHTQIIYSSMIIIAMYDIHIARWEMRSTMISISDGAWSSNKVTLTRTSRPFRSCSCDACTGVSAVNRLSLHSMLPSWAHLIRPAITSSTVLSYCLLEWAQSWMLSLGIKRRRWPRMLRWQIESLEWICVAWIKRKFCLMYDVTRVNACEPAIYMNYMRQSNRSLHSSNSSVVTLQFCYSYNRGKKTKNIIFRLWMPVLTEMNLKIVVWLLVVCDSCLTFQSN